jgi:hypothetical protein
MFRRWGAAAAVCGILLAACGSSPPKGVDGAAIKPIAASRVPSTILGFEVHVEDVKNSIARTDNSYVKAVSVFSLRDENLVQATLQVSELTSQFNARSGSEKATLADKIGGSRAAPFHLGADTVYLTQGQRQRVAVWFRAKQMYVLSVRDAYDKPRSLLRAVLEIQL